jgi:Carboxypeptidase regulatory-like domain
MRSATKGIRFLGSICLLLAVSPPLISQTTTGRILGEVFDSSGAALAGATVTVTDTQRATSRVVQTDSSGNYAVPNLVPGVYGVRAEAKGFKAVERPNIRVEVATDLTVDLTLPPGDVRQTVVVTDDVPLVNLTTASVKHSGSA